MTTMTIDGDLLAVGLTGLIVGLLALGISLFHWGDACGYARRIRDEERRADDRQRRVNLGLEDPPEWRQPEMEYQFRGAVAVPRGVTLPTEPTPTPTPPQQRVPLPHSEALKDYAP